uniref:G_PROTEIN_RECEP_F1_2 domain-containing protein n=1 Tax=Caenorhabditis japonica TaxID=281687 RepID=A0A8R1I1H3_CAEJA
MSEATQQETQRVELSFSYTLELWMYGIAFCVGLPSFIFTVIRLARSRSSRQHLVLAARLFSYKISLTVADCIVLFIYAPTQFAWIHSYWWFGGDIGCRLFKFISTFGFHLTATMQVLVAADRLLITAKMNRVTRNIKKRQYNTRLSLAIAWILALICAGPQLILFRQKTTPQGYPQCISIWTEHRVDFYDRLELLEQWAYIQQELASKSPLYFFENGTLKYPEEDFPTEPGFTLEELHTNNRNWLYLERLYNVLHLATICVIPYALELIFYTLILYILKGAARGRFVTLSDIIKDIFCCCTRIRNHESPLESNVTQESDNLMVRVPSRTKRLQNIAPEGDMERRRAASVDVPMRIKNSSSLTVCIDENGSATAAKRNNAEPTDPEPAATATTTQSGFFQRIWNFILDIFHIGSEGSVNFTVKKTELRLTKRKLTKSEDTRNGQHLVTVFSDEKLFTVEAEFNSQNHRVLAKDLQKAFDKGKTVHRVSHPAKVMVFGAICSTGKCPLVFVEKDLKITKEYYVKEILEKQLLPWAQQHFNGQHWICQQDGAPPHTAKYTQDWCKAHLPAFIEKDRWPASSPDLNPIDFSIWGVLQNKVCARPHSSVEALKKTLGEEWDQLSIEYLRATVESYPRRLLRRQSAPASARSNTMWVVTVDTARRNARWKAFIMLSLNLVFWAPYCILAITSSVIISQYLTNFQFVNALVTFNAVSNIIL